MDRQKSRKNQESRRLPCDGEDFSTNGKDQNEKSKHKRHSHNDKKKYEISPKSYLLNWSPPGRMQSVNQRQFSTTESVCHYSVPLSFSFEPVSLPIYPALIQPQANCTVPLEVDNHSATKHHRSYSRRRQNKSGPMEQNATPAIFQTPRINAGDQQDYTSLPPVNCELYTTKVNDAEPANRRRFSDPGLGQLSSDECSSSRSDDTCNTRSETPDIHTHDFYTLAEQINELKENNSNLKKELDETKLELETLKSQAQTWKMDCEDFKPGALADAISEIRSAVKMGEEALVSKVLQMLEKNSHEFKEAQIKFEERLKEEMNEKLLKLEEHLSKTSLPETVSDLSNAECSEVSSKYSEVQQQLVELEQEKFHLRKELQEAVAKRKMAEASTEKLERLVAILRKKVNGVSLESCIPDEKQFLVRPLASSLEKNPFIIANNKQGQKADTLPFCKPKIPSYKLFPLESNEGGTMSVNENKENDAGVSNGNPGSNASLEAPSVTAQVTITGPVTDL